MHRAFEISEANTILHTSVRFLWYLQKAETGIARSSPIRAVTLIEQSPQQNYSSGLPHQLKFSGYATVGSIKIKHGYCSYFVCRLAMYIYPCQCM